MSHFYHSQILLYLDKLLYRRSDFPNQFFRFSFDSVLSSNKLHIQSVLFIQPYIYKHVEKTSIHDWADLFSPEISVLLCFHLVNELLLYMYLSQLMSTFTKLSKSALSSLWFLHPESQEPVIQQSHMYLLIHWLVIQEYIGEITFQ